ncbi:MAG TPA: flagellar basal body L-ring protein FlgH [Novosphingobium sp.]|nr:flagellar basal body L-ring protein FlgH [Novosphingobium sp.]HZV11518.1 flagellar basal body L-ring protein FlgH [Novosphingobium sp.]
MARPLSLALLAAALCAPMSALAGKPPKGFAPVLPDPVAPQHAPDGAIFSAAQGYAPLVYGARGHGVGDIVTIALNEATNTTKTTQTKTSRSGLGSITPPTAGPFAINPNALNASSTGSFNGQGSATQTDALTGTITVTIAEVRPNGTVLVRGEKRMNLSQGMEWVQFSGILRLADIDQNNTVQSTQVADARLEYAGNGTVQRAGREGWLSRFFSIFSPF